MYYKNYDTTLYYEKHGNGKQPLIILPGWGDTRKTFNDLVNYLKDYFTIYIFDYPGFGNSSLERDFTIYDYSDLIKDFLLDNEINNPIVISHSFGARIAIILSGKEKVKFRKLIIIDGAGIKRRKSIKILIKQYTYKFLKKLKYLLPKKKRNIYLQKLIDIFGSTDYKSLNNKLRKTFINVVSEDLRCYLKNIKCATLLIWGEHDQDTPLKDGRLMNKKISDAGLVVITNTSHFPYLENATYVKKIIYEFLKVYMKNK